MLLHDIGSQVLSVEVSTDLLVKDVIASGTLAWYPVRRKSAWYTLMRFRLIKNGVAHAYDIYTV